MTFPNRVDDSLRGRVEDMIRAFEAEAYLSSISLALSVPDICGKYLNPSKRSSGEYYAKWFDDYIASNYVDCNNSDVSIEECYFDGNDCYQLRCVFLHEGTNAPGPRRGKTVYNLAQFRVFKNASGVGIDRIGRQWSDEGEGRSFRQVDLDLRKFLDAIASGVEAFLARHPDANSLCPLDGPESFLYGPIVVFD